MLNITVFMYEMFGSVFALFVPTVMLMFLLFLIIMIGKGFVRSIRK